MPDTPSYERVDHRQRPSALDDSPLSTQLTWLIAVPAAVAAGSLAATAGYLANGGHTALLVLLAVAIVTVLTAAVYAVGRVRRAGDRSGEWRTRAADSAAALAETRAQLADARNGLAGAHAEIERLRQAGAAPVPPAAAPGPGRQVEVFVNLSRRLQSLVHREIKLLDALENEVEDPDLLKGLFQVDHLATRIRRHAENLAVLGGSVSRRQWSRPVALTEVLRSAIAEVEHYSRVKLVPPIEGTLPGHAVASVVHLIAELIENATMFAPPHTQVLLRAQQVAAGVAVEVEDRGLGMQRADQERVNQLLANPEHINLDELLRDGRIGLYVVSMIARQHGIVVQLQSNIYGGTQAVVILPQQLLGAPGPERQQPAGRPASLSELTTEIPQQSARPVSPPAVRARPVNGSLAERQRGRHLIAGNAPEQSGALPPLPRRRSQTHMAPQLKAGAPQPAAELTGEHDPGLMASFMHGVSQGEADPADPNRLA